MYDADMDKHGCKKLPIPAVIDNKIVHLPKQKDCTITRCYEVSTNYRSVNIKNMFNAMIMYVGIYFLELLDMAFIFRNAQ